MRWKICGTKSRARFQNKKSRGFRAKFQKVKSKRSKRVDTISGSYSHLPNKPNGGSSNFLIRNNQGGVLIRSGGRFFIHFYRNAQRKSENLICGGVLIKCWGSNYFGVSNKRGVRLFGT